MQVGEACLWNLHAYWVARLWLCLKGQTQLGERFQLLFAEEAVCLVVAVCLSDSCVLLRNRFVGYYVQAVCLCIITVNRRSCCPVWRSQKLLVDSVGVRVTLKPLLSSLLTRPQGEIVWVQELLFSFIVSLSLYRRGRPVVWRREPIFVSLLCFSETYTVLWATSCVYSCVCRLLSLSDLLLQELVLVLCE